MKKYAMILLDYVIDVIEAENPPVYPPDPDGNEVIAMECDDTVQVGDVVVNGVIIGTYVETEPEPTQLDRIEAMVSKSQQDIIDEYTLELVEGGII